MKLEKFYAETMAEALTMIQKKLGDDAIIYSQEKTARGIEVTAGLLKYDPPVSSQQTSSLKSSEQSQPDKPKKQDWHAIIESLDKESLHSEMRSLEKLHMLQTKLRQLKFPYDFVEKMTSTYSTVADLQTIANNELIIKFLLTKIQIEETELIDTKKICAVVGPTGIGKSTTIAKLAKRFGSQYGTKHLGIISTDFQRIISKNQFHHFGKLLNIHIEYASDAASLKEAIHVLDEKRLILIDTAGVSQNDNRKIASLFEKLSREIPDIASYLVLPCNLQSDILNDVVSKFKMPHTSACILTKKDECQSIAPALSVVIEHELPIAYWCDGQNIAKDIHVPSRVQIVNAVFQGEKREGRKILPA